MPGQFLALGIFALEIDRHEVLLHQVGIVLQVDGNYDIRPHCTGQRDGNRVHDATVDKPVTVVWDRRHEPRHAAGGAHGKMDIPFG